MFFLVSGAAASGKSTTAKGLKARIDGLVCHDADERRVADVNTRCQHLEEWIQLALQHQAEGKDFLLTSHSPLGELLACPSAPKLSGLSAALIDCSDPMRITRMRRRGFDPRWPPSQHVLNWASWHRMHAWDSQWQQDVIVGNGSAEHDYTRWTSWQQHDPRWQVQVVDTTSLEVEQVLDTLITWIQAKRAAASLLTPETNWWQ